MKKIISFLLMLFLFVVLQESSYSLEREKLFKLDPPLYYRLERLVESNKQSNNIQSLIEGGFGSYMVILNAKSPLTMSRATGVFIGTAFISDAITEQVRHGEFDVIAKNVNEPGMTYNEREVAAYTAIKSMAEVRRSERNSSAFSNLLLGLCTLAVAGNISDISTDSKNQINIAGWLLIGNSVMMWLTPSPAEVVLEYVDKEIDAKYVVPEPLKELFRKRHLLR